MRFFERFTRFRLFHALPLALGLATAVTAQAASWEPTKTVEFIVPAGTGGGADQMARLIQGIVTKNKLMKSSMVVVNKGGGAGAEGFLDIKNSKGDAHKIVITLSNLFTTPLATGVPFSWKDMTPVTMLALDEFVLWVNADTPHKNAKDYLAAVKASGGKLKIEVLKAFQADEFYSQNDRCPVIELHLNDGEVKTDNNFLSNNKE